VFGKRGEVSLEKVDRLAPPSCVGIVESDIHADVGFQKQGTEETSSESEECGAVLNATSSFLDHMSRGSKAIVSRSQIERLFVSAHLAQDY